MTKTQYSGQCLCKAVSVKAEVPKPSVGACHCGMCRKWGGGPLMAVECKGGVEWAGEDHISVYSSSEWAERGFCKACGTHLFYRLKGTDFYALPAGLLSGVEGFAFDHEVCIDRKPGNYDFAGTRERITEAELFARAGA